MTNANDYLIIYRNFLDMHTKDAKKWALEDTIHYMALNEKISKSEAQSNLDFLISNVTSEA